VSALASQVKNKAGEHRTGCQDYARRLKERLDLLAIADVPRLKTAQAVQALADRLHAAEADSVVATLASAEVATSEAAMGTVLVKAGELAATLDTFNWEILDAVGRLTDERRAAAVEADQSVREALAADEQAVPLAPAFKAAQSKAVRLLAQQLSPKPPAITPPAGKPFQPPPGRRPPTVREGEKAGLSLAEARQKLDLLEKEARAGEVVTISLAWQVVEGGGEP
jgi:hypothetical protein